MSAESERVFSGARRTIRWDRASLTAEMVEMMQCLKHLDKVRDITGAFRDAQEQEQVNKALLDLEVLVDDGKPLVRSGTTQRLLEVDLE